MNKKNKLININLSHYSLKLPNTKTSQDNEGQLVKNDGKFLEILRFAEA